jgi:hypothetical protein
MTEIELKKLKERIKEGNSLYKDILKCRSNVILYTRFDEAAQELSNRKEWTQKKLNEWLTKLDKAKENFKQF